MKTTLIVEDVELNIDLLTQILEEEYSLLGARDGAQGVALTEQEKPDLVLMDISLPVMDGYEAASIIRKTSPSLPIIEAVFPNVKNRSKTITAEIEVPANGGNGTVIAQGGRLGGWSLYVKDGVPAYHYNFLGLERYTVAAKEKLKTGKATMRFDFAYDGGGPAKGGMGTLFVNDDKVAEGRIERTQPGIFSADETADVGIDLGTPVVEAIGAEAKSRFTGKIPTLTVQVHQ